MRKTKEGCRLSRITIQKTPKILAFRRVQIVLQGLKRGSNPESAFCVKKAGLAAVGAYKNHFTREHNIQ